MAWIVDGQPQDSEWVPLDWNVGSVGWQQAGKQASKQVSHSVDSGQWTWAAALSMTFPGRDFLLEMRRIMIISVSELTKVPLPSH